MVRNVLVLMSPKLNRSHIKTKISINDTAHVVAHKAIILKAFIEIVTHFCEAFVAEINVMEKMIEVSCRQVGQEIVISIGKNGGGPDRACAD